MALQYLDRSIRPPTSAAQITQRFASHDEWLMTDAERAALAGLLQRLKPQCAIEVGVYRAGSLALLAEHCPKVYALDIDPECSARYRERFPNVTFITGPSQETLPRLIEQLQAAGEPLDFVLIDADHTEAGVRGDVTNVLRYRPQRPLYIVMHDSFNPGCRRGIREAPWADNPYAHLLELDFVVGRFVNREEPDGYRQMWCGLALGILLPEKRVGDFVIHQNEPLMYQSALRHSVYRYDKWWNPIYAATVLGRRLRHATGEQLKKYTPELYTALRKYRYPHA